VAAGLVSSWPSDETLASSSILLIVSMYLFSRPPLQDLWNWAIYRRPSVKFNRLARTAVSTLIFLFPGIATDPAAATPDTDPFRVTNLTAM
jgi:hypothetical protein